MPYPAYQLQNRLATVKEETRRFKTAMRQQLHEALDQLDPIGCLGQAA